MYKYRFHYLLRQLSYEDYQIAMIWIPERLGISISTWKRWIYLKRDSNQELPEHFLSALASFFQCEVKDLKTDSTFWELWKDFQLFKSKRKK